MLVLYFLQALITTSLFYFAAAVEEHAAELQDANGELSFGAEVRNGHAHKHGYASGCAQCSTVAIEIATGVQVYQAKEQACDNDAQHIGQALAAYHAYK